MTLLSSTGRQPLGRRHTTPMGASGLAFTATSGGTTVTLTDTTTVTYQAGGTTAAGSVTLSAGQPVVIYPAGETTLSLDTLSYCLFVVPGVAQLYACREQDYAALRTAMDIVPRYYLRGPHDLWLPPRLPNAWTPGVDPSHLPHWRINTNVNGKLVKYKIEPPAFGHASAVTVDGVFIPIIPGYVDIPGPAPGTFDIWVDALGNLQNFPGVVKIATAVVTTRDYNPEPALPVFLDGPAVPPVHFLPGPLAMFRTGLVTFAPSEYGTGTTVTDGQGTRIHTRDGVIPVETLHTPGCTSSPEWADSLTALMFQVSTNSTRANPIAGILWTTGDSLAQWDALFTASTANTFGAGIRFYGLCPPASQPPSSFQDGPAIYNALPGALHQTNLTPGFQLVFTSAIPPTP